MLTPADEVVSMGCRRALDASTDPDAQAVHGECRLVRPLLRAPRSTRGGIHRRNDPSEQQRCYGYALFDVLPGGAPTSVAAPSMADYGTPPERSF